MNTFGSRFQVTTFGESHGPAIGCVIDGCPPGLLIDEELIQKELDRRRPGKNPLSSKRNEDDKVEILSGVFEGKATGTPIALIIRNKDTRPEDYEGLRDVFRPGHADRSYLERYGFRDHRGGGRSSGRETAARVAAGAVAKKILSQQGVTVVGHAVQIGSIHAEAFDETEITRNAVSCGDKTAAPLMAEAIIAAQSEKDSIGGIIEILVRGVKPGLGNPVFGKLDALIAYGLFTIGSVKGVEFGAGFAVGCMHGHMNNDQMDSTGYLSNNAGGILGGISTGQEIIVRCAIKPTPSIGMPQKTVGPDGKERMIRISGRHDPCIVPRVIPVAEAMIAIVLADLLAP